MVGLKWNLSDELIFSSVAREHGKHIVLTSRNEHSLGATHSSDLTSMCLKNKTEILLLVPNVDTSIGSTRVADTMFVKGGTVELGLSEFRSESSVLEQFLASISWVPELNRS